MATQTDNDPRTTAELEIAMTAKFKEFLAYFEADAGDSTMTMTDATETIYGSSGRGNPRAVRILETLAEYGYLAITGSKKRLVRITDAGRGLLAQ